MPSREHEFGVPFPGEVVAPERRTRARVALPRAGEAFDWAAAFGRADAGRVVDLGCGNGRYLLGSALARPGHDHLGIDLVPQSIAHAARRAGERGLANAKFAQGDAIAVALGSLAADSVDEVHVYHPQPYYDPEKRSERMLTPELVGAVYRALRAGGMFVLQTDNPYYWRHIETTVPVLFDWRRQEGPWPDAPEGRTRREILARDRGLRVFRGWGTPRRGLSPEEVAAILARLPEPRFDANRPAFREGGAKGGRPRARPRRRS
ncbi:MAG TPA: methyltransferase domain-containing protein [Planctomycetota bacterium]|nr:methyltransferase domain-containing protein [Planctomycetota bacterium]